MMSTSFFFDLRKLDAGVEAKVAEISAHAAAYYKTSSNRPHYAFFLQEVDIDYIPLKLLKIPHTEERTASRFLFYYKEANLLFLPSSETPILSNGSTHETWNAELKGKCEAIYARGKFYHGDAEIFRRYGITMLNE